MQDNSSSTKNIFDAIEPVSAEEEVTEFVFGEEPTADKSSDNGVVFDFGTEPSGSANDVEAKTDFKSSTSKLHFDDTKEEKPKEFSVPERFKVDERFNVPSGTEEAPRIITTYVPRFTDASLNYKMRDSSSPRPEIQKKDPEPVLEDATSEFLEDIDPTAEIDCNENTVPTVVVGNQKDEELTSATTVFKFASEEPVQEEVCAVEETVQETVEEEPSEDVENGEEAYSEPRVLAIPDPDDDKKLSERSSQGIVAYSNTPVVAPRGIGDPLPEKKGAKEYDSFSKREGFKESFLDKLLSLKVRFFAALAIAFFALAFECLVAFGVDLTLILGITGVSGAIALLDVQFVIALYLLAIPETVNALIALVRKKVTAELYLSVALSVILAYTAVIVASAPQDYPLFGFLYSVYVLSAIASAYFKVSSDFKAFKRVSTNGEKIACDNKLTRTLERENVALDGRVEEYKSRTVRTFRTLFVSDFFNRSNITVGRNGGIGIILASSLGFSLVTGVIAYFIPGGWDSAVSAFALVFLLACPAFSILLTILPMYHAKREIDKEKSAMIGE